MNNLEFTLEGGTRFFYLNPNVVIIEQQNGKACVTDTNLTSSKIVKETYEELRVKAGLAVEVNPRNTHRGFPQKHNRGPL